MSIILDSLFDYYDIDDLFQDYIQQYDGYKELCENEFPRNIRYFDIRFRLCLGLIIGFESKYSYTKYPSTRKTYQLLMKNTLQRVNILMGKN